MNSELDKVENSMILVANQYNQNKSHYNQTCGKIRSTNQWDILMASLTEWGKTNLHKYLEVMIDKTVTYLICLFS